MRNYANETEARVGDIRWLSEDERGARHRYSATRAVRTRRSSASCASWPVGHRGHHHALRLKA